MEYVGEDGRDVAESRGIHSLASYSSALFRFPENDLSLILMLFATDGELETSKETSSVKPNPTPNPKPVLLETRSVPNATPPISPSRPSAANPVPTSSIPNKVTIEESNTVQVIKLTISVALSIHLNGMRILSAWTVLRCGSVGIYGRMLREVD